MFGILNRALGLWILQRVREGLGEAFCQVSELGAQVMGTPAWMLRCFGWPSGVLGFF